MPKTVLEFMIDIRQSPQYADYLKLLGWQVEKINGCPIFIRQLPLISSLIKIQRPERIPSIEKILAVAKKYRAFRIVIEPSEPFNHSGFRPSSPSLPSKTLHIDLTKPKEQIFADFSSAKRRAIRRAIKNKVVIEGSDNIESFIKLKNQQGLPLTLLLRYNRQLQALWQAFLPQKATLLLAFDTLDTFIPIAGLFLLFHDQVAYYYQAASTKKGNKLAAPSLLVWEAIKFSKKGGHKIFDFEGIYDSRFSQKSWLGFTKFKKGFGGKEITYPRPLAKTLGSFT